MIKIIDIHSHVLPNIDHGSDHMDTTIAMLKKAKNDGIKKVVATPHFCIGSFEVGIREIEKSVRECNSIAKKKKIDIEIYSGQEVLLCREIIESYDNGIIGTINKTRYMLVEFNFMIHESEYLEIMYELKLKGITPILAHPERYIYFQENPKLINKYIDEGILFQLNSSSLINPQDKITKKTANIFLKHGIYSFIGSDTHSLVRRPPILSPSIKACEKHNKNYGEIFEINSEKMLLNKDVEFAGEKISSRRVLSFIY